MSNFVQFAQSSALPLAVCTDRHLSSKTYDSGEVVMRQWMTSDGMYILLDGDAAVYQRPSGGSWGESKC